MTAKTLSRSACVLGFVKVFVSVEIVGDKLMLISVLLGLIGSVYLLRL